MRSEKKLQMGLSCVGRVPLPPLWWTICWFFSDIGPGSALCGSRLSGNVQLVDRRPTQAGRPSVRRYDFSQCERESAVDMVPNGSFETL